MMELIIPAIDFVAVAFALAAIIMLVFKRRMQTKLDIRFLFFAGIILLATALINFLTHAGIVQPINEVEDFLLNAFFPIFIFAIYSHLIREELQNRKVLETETRRANQQLTDIFDAIPVLLLMYDRSDQSLMVNKEVERTLGWTTGELQDRSIIETFMATVEAQEVAKKNVRNFDGIWTEYPVKTKNGEVRIQRWSRIALDGNKSIGIGIDVDEQRKMEAELAREQSRFEFISKATNDVLYDWDLDKDTAWWSRGWETHFGFPKDFVGSDFNWLKGVIHPDDLADLDAHFERVKASSSKRWSHQYRILNPKGEVIHVLDRGYFIRNENGKATGIMGALVNITNQKEVEQLLRESEEKYRIFFDKSPMAKIIYDPETMKIIELNSSAVELYGYSRDEIAGFSILDLFVEEAREQAQNFAHIYKGKTSPALEWKHLTKAGKLLMVQVQGSSINYFGNNFRLAIIKDITKQREAEEKLLSSFIEGENKERSRLAQELHDGIGQYLAAANMNLDAINKAISTLGAKEIGFYEKGITYLRQAMSETRTVSHNLMPRIVSESGLALAVGNLVDSFKKADTLEISYYQNIDKLKLGNKIQINLYRIVQECLNNIIKHANASSVNVQLIKDGVDLILTIEDNGKGFDTSNESPNYGLGLNGIKTRAFVLGGIFDIETKKNQGTLITVSIPITQ